MWRPPRCAATPVAATAASLSLELTYAPCPPDSPGTTTTTTTAGTRLCSTGALSTDGPSSIHTTASLEDIEVRKADTKSERLLLSLEHAGASMSRYETTCAAAEACTADTPQQTLENTWLWLRTLAQSTALVLRTSPVLTILVPLLVLSTCLVAGEMGVWAAANNFRSDKQATTVNIVNTLANELDSFLQALSAPTIAIAHLVSQRPRVPDLIKDGNVWMASVLRDLDPDNATMQLSFFPWNVKIATWPWSAVLASQVERNMTDYNKPTPFHNTIRWAAEQHPPQGNFMDLVGPLPPVPENCVLPGFCARTVLWLPSSDPNETWGNNETFTTPWITGPKGPLLIGNKTVHPKYRSDAWGNSTWAFDNRPLPQAGQQLVYWGFVNHCVCMSTLMSILDPLMQSGNSDSNYKFVLSRRVDSSLGNPGLQMDALAGSSSAILYESATSAPRATEVTNACMTVGAMTSLHLIWELCISPVDGYNPPWELPLQAAVAVISLILALLVFLLILAKEDHKMLVDAMLPARVVRCLKLGKTYAERFRNVTILFSDIVNYTNLSSELSPDQLVTLLDRLYNGFDDLVDKHHLYKVETIGDAFMCVGGAPEACHPRDAALRVARMARDMIQFAESFKTHDERKIKIRVGIYSGDVTAAVMGRKMPHWCLVGDTVNVSSRMESNSQPMQIHVGSTTAALLRGSPEFVLEPRGVIEVKGKGPMQTFWLRQPQDVDASVRDYSMRLG